jgi:hypothetical protein
MFRKIDESHKERRLQQWSGINAELYSGGAGLECWPANRIS